MSQRERHHVGSFQAKDEAGNKYTIDVFQDFITTRTSSGTHRVAGTKELKCNGEDVNRDAKGKYQFVIGGKKLTSDDPSAE